MSDKADLRRHFEERAVAVATAASVQANVPRFCSKCHNTFLTTYEWNSLTIHGDIHGCFKIHTCENIPDDCNRKEVEFFSAHPKGRKRNKLARSRINGTFETIFMCGRDAAELMRLFPPFEEGEVERIIAAYEAKKARGKKGQ